MKISKFWIFDLRMMILFVILFLSACAVPPEDTFKQNMTLAENGDMKAQIAVAESYQKGLGVPQSYVKAIQWYKKASKNGCTDCDERAANAAELQAIDWYNKGQEKLGEFLD